MSRRSEHLYNTTRDCYRKRSQVIHSIGRTTEWVEEGVSYRELSLSEVLAIRAGEAKRSEPLPPKEIHGIVERMPKSEVFTPAIRYELLGQARELCEAR